MTTRPIRLKRHSLRGKILKPAGVLRVFSPNMKISCKFSWQFLEMNNGQPFRLFRSCSDQAWQPYSPFFSDLYNRLGQRPKERLQLNLVQTSGLGVRGRVARQVRLPVLHIPSLYKRNNHNLAARCIADKAGGGSTPLQCTLQKLEE